MFHQAYVLCSVLAASLQEETPPKPLTDAADQRFVSSTRNIEVLLSHTHSIVCDNDIGGLF